MRKLNLHELCASKLTQASERAAINSEACECRNNCALAKLQRSATSVRETLVALARKIKMAMKWQKFAARKCLLSHSNVRSFDGYYGRRRRRRRLVEGSASESVSSIGRPGNDATIARLPTQRAPLRRADSTGEFSYWLFVRLA